MGKPALTHPPPFNWHPGQMSVFTCHTLDTPLRAAYETEKLFFHMGGD